MKKYIYILIALLLPLTASAEYTLGTVSVTIGGNPQAAVARLDATNQIALLGNGYNSCIPYWSQGPLVIPGTVNIDGAVYTVEVGPVAFRLCNSLTEITIGEGTTTIGDYAFVGCSSVLKITLPSTLTSIERGAFVNMKSLKFVNCKATTAPGWNLNDVFSSKGTKASMTEMAESRILYVPEGSQDSYVNTKYDGSSHGWETVGWQDAFTRIYELSDEPQTIDSADDLIAFRDAVNVGAYYKNSATNSVILTTDIDLSNILTPYAPWTPIGTSEFPYNGVFDGGGHTINKLYVNSTADYQGLFGYANKAIIYNLHLQNPKVEGNDYVGSLLGYAENDTHITDVLVTSNASESQLEYTVRAKTGSGGGIVGYAQDATIERCMFKGIVWAKGWAGGIIGNVYTNVTITDCSASHYILNDGGTDSWVGGIVGGAGTVTVRRCFARNILADNNSTGTTFGIFVGGTNRTERSSIIENCVYWINDGSYRYYGLIGTWNYQPTLSNNKAYGGVYGMTQDNTKDWLGEDNWYYFTDDYPDYPVPITLADMYITKCVNVYGTDGLVYRPKYLGAETYEVCGYTGNATSLTIPATIPITDALGYTDPHDVTSIGANAFKDNASLKTITIGNKITNIKASAFENCDALTTINWSSALTTIGARAFYDCDALTIVDLPDAVNNVGRDAFVGCDNLTSFNIGTGFQDHTNNFIAYCPKLTTLTASRGNNNGYLCVDNVLLHNAGSYRSYVIACAPGITGDYVIPVDNLTNSTVNVFGSCFATCEGLTSVTFPAGKTYSLGKGVFDGAYNLRYVDLSAINGTIEDARYTVNRSDTDSPFYGMSKSTIIYLPSGHNAADDEVNAVIGGTANSIELYDGWDFNPPVAITAGKASLSRSLTAKSTVYARVVTDENGDPVYLDESVTYYDENNNLVTRNLPKMESEERYDPRGYTTYLPYAMTLTAENAKVYAPSTIEDVDGVTTVTFAEVESKEMAAYTPYYIVVEGEDAVELNNSSTTTIAIPPTEDPAAISGFMFKGTTVEIPNTTLYDADKPAYILQSDGWWHKVPQNQPLAYVGPFRAYFQATGASNARSLAMMFGGSYNPDEGNGPTAIQPVIRTIDSDGSERYFDLNGRRIDGNAKGVIIKNGKKYLNK